MQTNVQHVILNTGTSAQILDFKANYNNAFINDDLWGKVVARATQRGAQQKSSKFFFI